MQKVSAVNMQQRSSAVWIYHRHSKSQRRALHGQRALFQARGSLQELGISTAKPQGTLERERGQHRRKYLVAPSAKQSDVRTQ